MDGASITVNTSESDDISITCSVTATNPIITSLKLTSSPLANNVYFDNVTGIIIITDATVDNAGTYTCTADNGVTTPTNINFVLVVNPHPITTTINSATDTASKFAFTSNKSFM